jgi:hypothetical protein
MGVDEFLRQFDWAKLAFFLLFALPGFISLRVWRLIVPTDDRPLKDEIAEAVGFGLLNAAVGGPLIVVLANC